MIKNFFLTALRNISRNKVFTVINITGLAIGLAASLLILLWIQDELSFERYNVKAENIYRVEEDQNYSGEIYHVTVTPHPSGPEWKEKIPEIKEQTRISWLPRLLFRNGDKAFFESAIVGADSGIFNIFTFPFLYGDPSDALRNPNSIVLTEKLAKKYFGNENPVGKVFSVENKHQLTVSGVMKDLLGNSIFRFEGLIPYSFLKQNGASSDEWGSNSILTFVLLEKGADINAVNKKLTDVVLEHIPQTRTTYVLFPLLDIHLHEQFGFKHSNGSILVLYIFTIIALFILLIASINFINLSTAKAASRAKEIGIRKVSGADQKTMIIQFMLESMIMVIIAMVFSFIIVGLLLNTFNNISGKHFILDDLFHWKFILSFIAVGLAAGLFSGFYPALYLSSFKPAAVLKGEIMQGKGGARLRKGLVILQFSLSVLIAVSATFMYLQVKYMLNKNLGFDKENLIAIPMSERMKKGYYSLKSDLSSETLIEGVTATMSHPVHMGSNSGGASWDGKDPDKEVLIGMNAVEYDYMKTMKIDLVSGRDFSRDFQGDKARDTLGNFMVNEEVGKLMNIDDPIGRNFNFIGLHGTIVGVMKNFHFEGADQPIEPMAFALADTSYLNFILVRLKPGQTKEALAVVESAWNKAIPDFPLQYTFIDQDYENLFRTEMRLSELLKYFTILAIIIACLGLYGLSSYSTVRRTNEIGIRKIMGADSHDVILTMIKEFLGPILISLVIALPLGWIIVEKLLRQFPYRIEINALVFLAIGISALLIAIFTVGYQAFRATRVNPAEALKIE